jgi:hypothetical protein
VVLVDPGETVCSEISRLRAEIGRVEAATETSLVPSPSWRKCQRSGFAERRELCRQLSALRQHVATARSCIQDPWELRAELATLLSFGKTLHGDALTWRAAREEAVRELERRQAAARREWERLAPQRRELARRRDALQLSIDETARRLMQAHGGEARRTPPVFAFAEGITVCSVSVAGPRSPLRPWKRWLVTFNESRDGARVRRQ